MQDPDLNPNAETRMTNQTRMTNAQMSMVVPDCYFGFPSRYFTSRRTIITRRFVIWTLVIDSSFRFRHSLDIPSFDIRHSPESLCPCSESSATATAARHGLVLQTVRASRRRDQE